eukprot:gene11020-19863_t
MKSIFIQDFQGNWGRGRPPLRWQDQVRKDTGLPLATAMRHAQDRLKWAAIAAVGRELVGYSGACKSPAAYVEVRDALGRKQGGILTLPCKRTLRGYKNWIRPKSDEMRIRANLIYEKVSEVLLGFVDLGDPHLNFGILERLMESHEHLLPYLLRLDLQPHQKGHILRNTLLFSEPPSLPSLHLALLHHKQCKLGNRIIYTDILSHLNTALASPNARCSHFLFVCANLLLLGALFAAAHAQ